MLFSFFLCIFACVLKWLPKPSPILVLVGEPEPELVPDDKDLYTEGFNLGRSGLSFNFLRWWQVRRDSRLRQGYIAGQVGAVIPFCLPFGIQAEVCWWAWKAKGLMLASSSRIEFVRCPDPTLQPRWNCDLNKEQCWQEVGVYLRDHQWFTPNGTYGPNPDAVAFDEYDYPEEPRANWFPGNSLWKMRAWEGNPHHLLGISNESCWWQIDAQYRYGSESKGEDATKAHWSKKASKNRKAERAFKKNQQ